MSPALSTARKVRKVRKGAVTLIGVTGGFCTGKTTVSRFFKKLGAHIIDADEIVGRLYRKDKKIKHAILKNFGEKILTRGTIDKRKLARITFTTRRRLNKLSRIIHPAVIKKIKDEIRRSRKSVIIVDAPLLIESGLTRDVDYVVVVKARAGKQLTRCAGRGFTKREALRRKASQLPLREKIKRADFVIDNNCSKRYTKKEVMKIWKALTRG